MINIYEVSLLDLLPPNLKDDPEVQALAKAITPELQFISKETDLSALFANIDQLPEVIIDLLLWQFSVEGVSLAETIQEKRDLVKNALDLHRLRGTKAGIEKVFELLNMRAIIKEWFEYEGDPYHFKIEILEVTNNSLGDRELAMLDRLVEKYKNARSWLEAINIYLTSRGKQYMAPITIGGEAITVYPWQESELSNQGTIYLGSGTQSVETITIYPNQQ